MIAFFAFYANRDLRKVQMESNQASSIILSLSTIEAILDDMQDLETGQRGYVLSGNENFLLPHKQALDRLASDTLRLKQLIILFPEKETSLIELLQLVRQKLDFITESIALRREKGFDSSLTLIQTLEGKRLMDTIRHRIASIEEADRVLLAFETQERQEAARSTSRLFNIMAISFFLFLSLLFWYAFNNLREKERYEKKISYLASLTENTSDAIISTDEKGIIRSWNKAAEENYGYRREEVIGKFAPSVIQSGLSEEDIKGLQSEILKKGLISREVLQKSRDGRRLFTMVSTSPIIDEKDQIRGFVSVIRDITDRKNLEEQLKVFNRELARQVEEKTANLLRANEQLAISNRDLEQFAYIASHDLQEPLRAVRSFLQLLEKKYMGQLDEQGMLYISQAVEGSKRMKDLITGLLNFSRLGRRQMKAEEVDMNQVANEVIQSLRPAVSEASVQVNLLPLPTVTGDAGQLGQVLQNLVSNAIKYRSLERTPEIGIGAEEKKQGVLFYVKDNGIGFDKKHEDVIFNVFYRLHTATEYPGTGIGLAICKKIVELHDGRIWVESEPGKGSTFYFTLPNRKAP
jgi:PAS domain S-box-containing protein